MKHTHCQAHAGAQPSAVEVEADPDAPFSETARKKLEKTAAFLANATKQAEANAPRTKLLDASELTEEDLVHIRKAEYFLPKSSTRYGHGASGTLCFL